MCTQNTSIDQHGDIAFEAIGDRVCGFGGDRRLKEAHQLFSSNMRAPSAANTC